MKIGGVRVCAVAAIVGGACAVRLDAAVDLELRPSSPSVAVGESVDIALFAVSDSAVNQSFSAMDVIVTWDAKRLELLGATDDGDVVWTFSGFMSDEQTDGINNTFSDGDAVYTGVSLAQNGVTATPAGRHVTTLHFRALGGADHAVVSIVPSRGQITQTKVYAAGQINTNIAGELGSAAVVIVFQAALSVADLVIPAGRFVDVVVAGDIQGEETFGITLVVQLVPRSGATGTVEFTPAPPSDIFLINDPWPVGGTVSVFDTDLTGSTNGNGAAIDNGTFVNASLTFQGDLAGFPVQTDAQARGAWDVKLCVDPCGPGDASQWDATPVPVPTGLSHGLLTVVELGDGDATESIDLLDFTQLQRCFTGGVGPIDPAAYSSTADLPCAVYDFDDDGDVDAADYASFHSVSGQPPFATLSMRAGAGREGHGP